MLPTVLRKWFSLHVACVHMYNKNFLNETVLLLNNSHFTLVPKLKCETEFTFLSYKYIIAKMYSHRERHMMNIQKILFIAVYTKCN